MKKIKIFYDHRIFIQKYGGISRYFNELITFDQSDYRTITSVIFSQNEYYSHNIKQHFLKRSYGKYLDRLLITLNYLYGLIITLLGNYDIYHPTYYKYDLLTMLNRKPMVLTVVDMIHEKYPQYFTNSQRLIKDKKKLMDKSTKIIAISLQTKLDILEIYDINPSKIEVIYLASQLKRKPFNFDIFPKKFVLFVGNRRDYKNFDNLLKAFSYITKDISDIYLICIGGGKFSSYEVLLMNELSIASKVIQHDCSDDNLWLFYENAMVFVFPSLYEGFGIPILEAFESSCPVVLSNSSCFPEIAGRCAIYFNPLNPDSIAKSIEKVIISTKLRNRLINSGRSRYNEFSWLSTTKKTFKLYSLVHNEN